MKSFVSGLSLLPAWLLPFAVFTADPNVLAQQQAAKLESKVIEWRRDLHRHPELSNREFRTAAKVSEHLQSLGLEVQTGVAHTGVVALLKGDYPGP